MGVVIMSHEFDFMHHGSVYSNAILYVYCDHCGSFKIKKYLDPRKWLAVLIGCGLVGALIYAWNMDWYLVFGSAAEIWFKAICIFWPLSFIPLVRLWGGEAFKCQKCGKPTTTRYNLRSYPSSKEILDIPEDQVVKLSLGYWTDLLDIDEWVKPPQSKDGS
jgi:hypothetical protein